MAKTKGPRIPGRIRKKMLRSRENGNRAFVTFLNATTRMADVIWVNFQGSLQSYTSPKGLSPTKRIDLRTYEEHPWIFRDRQTGDKLVCCSRQGIHEVYLPETWDGSRSYRAPVIKIVLPVYSLKERCLQVVRKLVKKEDIPALASEIPKSLQEELVHTKSSYVLQETN